MKRFILIALILIVVVAGVLVYHTLAKPAPKAADLVPESTLLFVDVPDFNKSREEFRKTAAYALWNEPEVQGLLEKPRAALEEAMGLDSSGKKGENGTVKALLNALQGEVFLAVTHVTLFPQIQAGVVVGVDVKGKRFEAMGALYKFEKRLKAQYPTAAFGAQTHLGIKYSVWEIRPGYPVCHAWLNSLSVFTLGEQTMHNVIEQFKRSPTSTAAPLSASRKYRTVVDRMPEGYEGLAYFNAEAVVELLGPLMMMPQVAGSLQKLARLQAAGSSTTFVDGGVQDVSFAAYRKGAAPKPPPVTTRKSLALTSPRTLLYAAGSGNLVEAYDEIMQSLVGSGNPNLAANAMRFEQTVRQRGVRIREDVLGQIGPESAIIGNWREGARFPDVAIVAELKNAARARPAVDDTLNALKETIFGSNENIRWDETDYRGHTLRTVAIGAGLVAPTYVVADNFFILTITPDYAKELLNRAAEAGPTLAANADYDKSMQKLPANGNAYAFCDLRGLFEPLYALARTELAKLGENSVVPADALPAAETIGKHLFPFTSATVADENSITTTTFSPVGGPLTMIGGVGLAAGIIVPQLPKSALPFGIIPGAPTKSSDMRAPLPAPENQTEASQTPAIQ